VVNVFVKVVGGLNAEDTNSLLAVYTDAQRQQMYLCL